MKNVIKLGIIVFVVIIGLLFTGCPEEADNNNSLLQSEARYSTVPYKAQGEFGNLKYFAYDDDSNYYMFLLGHVNRVPITYRTAIFYDGITPQDIYFEITDQLEISVMEAITTAESNTIANSSHFEWSVEAKAGFEWGPFGASVEAKTGGSSGWEESNTRSVSNTIETTISKLSGETERFGTTIGNNNEPAGKYRYAYFGTIDVYYILITDRNKTQVKEASTVMCARPSSYAWGIDYEPDLGGSFGKTDNRNLLRIPEFPLSSLPNPTIPIDNPIPEPVIDAKDRLSAGREHTLYIDNKGNLWAWGSNQYGQLGIIDTKKRGEGITPEIIRSGTKFIAISAGEHHSLAIDIGGNLWA